MTASPAITPVPASREDQCVGDLVAAIANGLATAGVDLAILEARLLVRHGLELTAESVFAHPERSVAAAQAAAVRDLAARRGRGEPLAYILGEREFWSLPIKVSPDVLIPRPETELLVETALALAANSARPLRILDLGTGSGCILLAILSECPQARGIGVDRSPAALAVASANARRLGLVSRCGFVCAHWGTALSPAFDLIVANPPYIDDDSFLGLDRGVRSFEPEAALRGGTDGLDAFRDLGRDLPRLLGEQGRAIIEIGAGQARAVETLLAAFGLRILALGRDLAGCERCLTVALK